MPLKLDFEVLMPPRKGSRLVDLNYHLTLFLRHTLQFKAFSHEDDPNQGLEDFFASKSKAFTRDGIQSLLGKGHK